MGKSRKLIAVLLALVFMFSAMTQSAFAATEASFSDITGHWAREEILRWSGNGVLAGNNGKFRPNEGITRAEFCAVINRVFGYVEKSDTLYSDVKSDKWYAGQIAIADAAGYISGYGNGKFGPEDIITRQDAAKMLKTAFKLDVKDAGTVISFNDNSGIASYAKDAVAILSSKGYIEGSNNHFYPQKSLTRAELAVIMDRAVGQLYSTAGTYSDGQVKDNVIVKTGAVVLKNMVIEGNLYLTEGVGQGNVTLNNVTVKGKTFANGGGENSIILQNTTLTTLVVEKKDGKIRILAQEGSSVANVQLNSGAKLQEEGANTQGFGDVEVLQILPGQQLVLDGDFEVVDIAASGVAVQITDGKVGNLNVAANASGSSIQIASGAQVSTLKADAAVSVGGEGQITKAQINATNVTIAQKPTTVEVAQGVTANVGGNTVTPPASSNNTPTPLWTLTWADEFNGTSVDTSKWNLVNNGGGFGNEEAQYYSPDNATIQNGNLVIEAKKEQHTNATSEAYTSAKLVSKFSQKYGKIEARIKLPVGNGIWPAFWMMPQNSEYGTWASSGEIDIMEARGRLPQTVCGTIHYGRGWPNNVYSGKDYIFPEGQDITQFHTYTLEWEPGEMRWYVDGSLYQTQSNWYTMGDAGEEKFAFPAPFDKEFFIQLNLAVGGNFDEKRLPPDSLFDSPVNMEVDYVRVYELTGRPYKTPVEPSISIDTLPEGARVADETGNLVKDVNFEQGINNNAEGIDANFGEVWNFVHNAQFNGAATTAVEEIDGTNYAKVNVTNRGTQPYSIQLEQLTTLGKGRWYRYSFDAKADKARTLNTKLGGGPSVGFPAYSASYTANLTTEMQHFSYEFQMTKNTDILARIEYNCATDTGSVWIGNVRVEEIDTPVVDYNAAKEALPSGNMVYNGAFDKYTLDRMAYWNVTKTDAAANVSIPETTRELKVDITNGGADDSAITVDQKGLNLESGNGYKLTFKARACATREIAVKLSNVSGSLAYFAHENISLTQEMQTFEFDFTMNDSTDIHSVLTFLVGGNSEDVYLDDVSLITTTIDYTNVDLYPVKNGDFSIGLIDWTPFTQDAAADFSVVNGEAKVAVSNVGSAAWNVMLSQKGQFKAGMEYELSFDARASVPRDILVTLESSDYSRKLEAGSIALTTESQHFSYTVKILENQQLELKFQLGKTTQAVAGDIFIDNVVLKVKNAPVACPPSFASDTTDNRLGQSMELVFGDDENWRNAVQEVKVDGQTLTNEQYTLSSGLFTLVPGLFTTAKSYDIVIIADGYADAKVAQDVLANDGNVVKNGSFSNGTQNWILWKDAGASFDVIDGTAKVDIATIGGANWSIQLYEENVAIEAGKTYKLSFKSWSTVDRPIQVELSGYKGNESAKFYVTSDDSAVHNYFISVPETNSSFKLNFLIGNVTYGLNNTPSDAHTLYIDDVVVKEVTVENAPALTADSTNNVMGEDVDITFTDDADWRAAVTSVKLDGVTLAPSSYTLSEGKLTINNNQFATDRVYTVAVEAEGYLTAQVTQLIKLSTGGPLVKNGTFDTNTANWTLYTGDGSNAALTAENGKMKIDFPNYDGWFIYSTQVYQENIVLEAGKTYTLSFEYETTLEKPILVSVEKASDYNVKYLNATTITTSDHIYSFDFTMGGTGEENAKILFQVGSQNVPGPQFTSHSLFLDNVRLTEKVNIAKNGTFESNTNNWLVYKGDGSDAAVTAENGKMKIDFPAYDGWFVYSTQVYQENIALEAGKTYTLSFEYETTLEKPIIVSIEKASDYNVKYLNATTITTSDQIYSFEFTMGETGEENAKILFQVGSQNVPGPQFIPHSLFFDNIKLTEKAVIVPLP